MQASDLILLGLYPTALCAAIGTDLAFRKIPNLVVGSILVGFVALSFLMPLPDLSLRLLVAAAVTGLGFSLFAENVIGAGDAKLAGVLMLWLDPLQVPLFIAASGAIGAFLTLAARAERSGLNDGLGLLACKHSLPYGVALAGAGLMLLPFSSLLHGG
ncbi:prepilin peptidase [Xanthobacter autotrophicus DSM 431]|uniref:A24 family peptidase n=1 Tax=Xanthobacter nonsaccharivorans TaxID=3119912 RepID=UPI003728D873